MARKINHIYHFKRGTSEKWKETNLVLDEGEPGFEIDTGKLKIGNGKTRWNTLPYIADIDKVVLNTEIKEAIKNLKEEIINSTFTTIDITELPIENINNNCFYRITTGIFTKYTGPIYNFACFMVSSLTETGFPFTNESEENYWVYYNISDETLYGYIDNILSEIHEIPIGWHAFNNLIETFDIDYGGIITSAKDINEESKSIYFLIEQTLYKHNGVWTAGVSIGNTGEGHHAEKFKSDSNIAEGVFSHAEGYHTGAYGKRSHAEGSNTGADGNYSHAEGSQTLAEGVASHAEGSHSYASGRYAHAEG